MLIDTHCHLGASQFETDRAQVVHRARAASVRHIIVIADSAASTSGATALAHQYGLSATAGVHPHEASSWNSATRDTVSRALTDPAVVAVGEIGLDYHYEHSPRAEQRQAFVEQLTLASERGLPAVVHSRSCDDDMIAMLDNTDATIVLHSFSSGPALLDLAIQHRFYVSFSGMVTFRSWRDDDAVRGVPADRLLVETDAPYLAPVPHRGKRNEPAFVAEVARRLAQVREVTFEALAAETTANAERCFGSRVVTRPEEMS